MHKHTTGSWHWRHEATGWYLSPGVLIADGTDGTPGGDELDRANARLIAAAPDLYALAKAFADTAIDDEFNEMLRAALAKVDGD
jgi:hypothetical protein